MTTGFLKTKDTYFGNCRNRVWPISYPFLSVQELQVTIVNPKGLSASVFKHLKFDAENACIIYPTPESGLQPLADGWSIVIERQSPLQRDLQLADKISKMRFLPADYTPLEKLARIESSRAKRSCKRFSQKD